MYFFNMCQRYSDRPNCHLIIVFRIGQNLSFGWFTLFVIAPNRYDICLSSAVHFAIDTVHSTANFAIVSAVCSIVVILSFPSVSKQLVVFIPWMVTCYTCLHERLYPDTAQDTITSHLAILTHLWFYDMLSAIVSFFFNSLWSKYWIVGGPSMIVLRFF